MSYPTLPPPAFPVRLPDHPRAITALVLGIVGIVAFPPLAPFAWSIGGKAVKEIDADRAVYGGRDQAKAGYILGIIGTVLLALYVVAVILIVIASVALVSSSST